MRLPWHVFADAMPESRLLDSVAEFTFHRDIDALDHSLVLSLAELVNVNAVALCKRSGDALGTLDAIVHCTRTPTGTFVVEAIDPTDEAASDAALQRCMDSLEPRTDRLANGVHRLLVPVQHDHRAIGVLLLESDEPLEEAGLLVGGFSRIYANYTALLNESERDKLTGLYNRRTFEQRLQRLGQRQRRQRAQAAALAVERRQQPRAEEETQLWLAILDIDNFKRINDGYGHVYGDEVILSLAQTMRTCFRQSDVLFRFGGEEFVVLLGSLDEPTAYAALERFRDYIATHPFPQVGHVTVSIGYARVNESDYPEIVLDRADKALYFAKQNGRNCVHGFEALTKKGALTPAVSGSIDLF
jgi:diguanylate cyclase (GGDEF)-like protein